MKGFIWGREGDSFSFISENDERVSEVCLDDTEKKRFAERWNNFSTPLFFGKIRSESEFACFDSVSPSCNEEIKNKWCAENVCARLCLNGDLEYFAAVLAAIEDVNEVFGLSRVGAPRETINHVVLSENNDGKRHITTRVDPDSYVTKRGTFFQVEDSQQHDVISNSEPPFQFVTIPDHVQSVFKKRKLRHVPLIDSSDGISLESLSDFQEHSSDDKDNEESVFDDISDQVSNVSYQSSFLSKSSNMSDDDIISTDNEKFARIVKQGINR